MKDESLISLEMKIAVFLRYGVLVSGFCLLGGWLWSLIQGEVSFLPLRVYHEMSLSESLSEGFVERDWSLLLSYFGLFILILLPVSRVVLTAVLFLIRRETAMAAIAFFVLVMLALGAFLGVAH